MLSNMQASIPTILLNIHLGRSHYSAIELTISTVLWKSSEYTVMPSIPLGMNVHLNSLNIHTDMNYSY